MIERKLVGVPLAIFGLMLWAGPAAAVPAGTVIAVSGSPRDHGRVLNRGDPVQIRAVFRVAEVLYHIFASVIGSISLAFVKVSMNSRRSSVTTSRVASYSAQIASAMADKGV